MAKISLFDSTLKTYIDEIAENIELQILEFVARIKKRSSNAVGTHCVIHREFLASRNLPATMNDKLAIAICVFNFIKTSSVQSRFFTALYNDMDADRETLLFHAAVRWLSKGSLASSGLRAEGESGAIPRCSRKSESCAFVCSRWVSIDIRC